MKIILTRVNKYTTFVDKDVNMIGPLMQSTIGRDFLVLKYLPTVDYLLEYRTKVNRNPYGLPEKRLKYELYIIDELLKLRYRRDELIGKKAIIVNDELLKSSAGFEVTVITVNFATDIPEHGYSYIVQGDDVMGGKPIEVQQNDILIK